MFNLGLTLLSGIIVYISIFKSEMGPLLTSRLVPSATLICTLKINSSLKAIISFLEL